jgi:DnaJ family protein B protein 4
MGRDYYGILGVPRNATFPEIRAGYKWNAMKWHPQKNPSTKVEAEQRFRDIAEAYDVLINPARRQRYDEQGERGLKYPAAGSGVSPYQYVGDPFALFVDFFSDANPLLPAYDLSLNSMVPGLAPKEVDKPIEVEVPCSLAELQDGSTRRVVVDRTRLGPNALPYKESKPITLPVRPGWKVGMRVTFRGEGNQTSKDKQPGDLVVVIAQQPFPMDDTSEARPEDVMSS